MSFLKKLFFRNSNNEGVNEQELNKSVNIENTSRHESESKLNQRVNIENIK